MQALRSIRDAADVLLVGGSVHNADEGVEQIAESVRVAVRKRGSLWEDGVQLGAVVQSNRVDVAISKAATEAHNGRFAGISAQHERRGLDELDLRLLLPRIVVLDVLIHKPDLAIVPSKSKCKSKNVKFVDQAVNVHSTRVFEERVRRLREISAVNRHSLGIRAPQIANLVVPATVQTHQQLMIQKTLVKILHEKME